MLTQAANMYPEILELHAQHQVQIRSQTGEEPIQAIHIPLSSYSRFPQILSTARKSLLQTPDFGEEFLQFALRQRITKDSKEATQVGVIRYQGKKQKLFAVLQ
ncbi:MAG: hypothetical protein H6765_01825 [Candidatus Peribacteria bacterium]|nr:MAG: hypothetical protein H6765_01825 [Candidatus Peribacteria bacterium]